MEELGGARTHNTKSGNAHYLAADEDDAIDYVKALLSLPAAEQPRRAAGRTTSAADLEVTDDGPRAGHADPGLGRTSPTTCTR